MHVVANDRQLMINISDTNEVRTEGPTDSSALTVINAKAKTYSERLGFCKGSEADGEDSGQALDHEYGGSGG